jgi:hypothetical protein
MEHHDMKACRALEVHFHTLLIWAIDKGKSSALRPGRFTPEEQSAGTYSVGNRVEPKDDLDALEKRYSLIL